MVLGLQAQYHHMLNFFITTSAAHMRLFLSGMVWGMFFKEMWIVIYNKCGYPLIPTDLELRVTVFIKCAFYNEEWRFESGTYNNFPVRER